MIIYQVLNEMAKYGDIGYHIIYNLLYFKILLLHLISQLFNEIIADAYNFLEHLAY